MKALISPVEVQTITYISAWIDGMPQYTDIHDCQRVAQVEVETFDVAPPLYWVDCPADCEADQWYYKDGLHKKPEDAPNPDENSEPV
jgi:hypothetical protein